MNKQGDMHKQGGYSPYITHQSEGLWTSGLCECHQDPYNCCLTVFCPFIVAGRIAEIADRGATACFAATCVHLVLESMLCGYLYSCMNRSKMRSHFSLPEAPCADFLVHCFCSRCALCQEHRELKNRGINPAEGWEANVERWNREQITPPMVIPGMTR